MTPATISYRYKSVSEAGRIVRGIAPAANENDLYRQLLGNGLQLIAARPARVRAAALPNLPFTGGVKPRELIVFSLHLEQLLKAGVPLLACLAEAEAMAASGTMRRIVASLHASLEHGALFSEALAHHPRIFDRIYIGLIETGERGGDLAKPLGHIVMHLKWREALGRRIGQALRYPLFALASALVSLVSLLVIVVPQLTTYLDMLGDQLPPETVLLLKLSSGLQHHYPALLAGALGTIIGLASLWRLNAAFRLRLDQLLLHLPLVGTVIAKTSLARFAHFTALLFENGVGLLACLEVTQRLLGNRYLAAAVGRAAALVEAGWSLSAALAETKAFPRFFLQMVKVGEESGNLAQGFETIREFYDRDAEDALSRLTASLQPAFVLIVGALLLWIVTAVLGPVYSSFATLPL
jgi:type IV pilus assembly protein PilC